MSTLCSVAFYFVFDLSFIFSFILYPSCIIIIVCSFITCLGFSLTLCLFLTKRGRVYSRKYTSEHCHFYITLVHIRKGRDYHKGNAYTKGDNTLLIRKLCFVCFLIYFMVLWVVVSIYASFVLIASCLCVKHAFIFMLLCFIEYMFGLSFALLYDQCSHFYVTVLVYVINDRNLLVILYLSFYYLLYLKGLICFVQVFQVTGIYVPSSSQLLWFMIGGVIW